MPLNEITAFEPVCDGCGGTLQDFGADYSIFVDRGDALDQTFHCDWFEKDGVLHCPTCQKCVVCGEEAIGLRNDENDDPVPVCLEHKERLEDADAADA